MPGASIAAALLLAACGEAGARPGYEPVGPDAEARRLVRQQATDALARWESALRAAGDQPRFVPAGSLTVQVGEWEPAVADNNRRALAGGLVEATAGLDAGRPVPAELTG